MEFKSVHTDASNNKMDLYDGYMTKKEKMMEIRDNIEK